jgi:hypothetical protein
MKQALFASSIVHGGGKRRGVFMGADYSVGSRLKSRDPFTAHADNPMRGAATHGCDWLRSIG